MGGIEQRLEPLQPVGADDPAGRLDVFGCQRGEFVIGEARRHRLPAHIDPYQPARLVDRVAAHRHALGEFLALAQGLGRRIDAFALDAEFPAVEDAAQPAFLVAREGEAGAAMRAAFLHEADPSIGHAEGDEVLAEQPDPLGRAVGLELGRAACGHPVFAQHVAHRRAGADPGEQFVVGLVQHRKAPLPQPLVTCPG